MKTLEVRGMPKSAQAGFTIIELIVVILLLGILTATALPRFLDVTDQAHDAVVDATFGGLQTGMALYRAGYIALGEPAAGQDVTGFGAGNLDTNANGYPAGTDGGTAVGSVADCVAIYSGVLQAGAPSIIAATTTSGTVTDMTDAIINGEAADADWEAFYLSTADTYAANSCIYVYMAQYATVTDATAASDSVPVIIYEPTGAVTLTSSSDTAID